MKKRNSILWTIALVALCAVFALTLCACESTPHTHTFETGFSGKDETSHWHIATCEHTDEISGKEAHTFENGECAVCGYKQGSEPHTHTFEQEYSGKDETGHWHIATCEHTNEISGKEEHTFENGVCAVCGYEPPVPKTRTVTFDVNGGDEEIEPMQFEVGKVMADLPTPIRKGYTFICWEDMFGVEYTAASVMPNDDLSLTAKYEKNITNYTDEYVSLKPASEGVKDPAIQLLWGSDDVDEYVYVEITSDDIGGVEKVGQKNNFNLRTIDTFEYKIKKSGYTWLWYEGDFNTPNGTQRFTLNYGSNIQLVTVSDSGGTVVKTYLVDFYVRHDYYVNLYESIFHTEPYDSVRVIENDRFSAKTEVLPSGNFEFDKRVYYNEKTDSYEPYVYSSAVMSDINLYQTYKPITLQANLDGGTMQDELTVTPYTQYFTLPTPTKDGYDFLGWKNDNGEYVTNLLGYTGKKFVSASELDGVDFGMLVPQKLTAVWAEKQMFFTVENDVMTAIPTVPVVTYTDEFMTEILEVVYTPYETDCVLPTVAAQKENSHFTGWETYAYNETKKDYNHHTSDYFDEENKVTSPIVLVPTFESSTADGIIPLNATATFNSTGTYQMYLPVPKSYTLEVTSTDEVSFTLNTKAGSNNKATNYTVHSGTPLSVTVYNYHYELGSEVPSRGVATIKVTEISGSFTAKLVGDTTSTVGNPVVVDTSNLANIGEEITFEVNRLGYKCEGIFDEDTQLSPTNIYTFNMPSKGFAYSARLVVLPEMESFVFTATSDTCEITGVKDKTITELTIPDYVTSISEQAFAKCENITSATIPTLAIAVIPKSKLETVSITSGTEISNSAFCDCNNITSVTIGNSVTSIGSFAFYNCINLTSITLPDSVTEIGIAAFGGCPILNRVNYLGDIASWCGINFGSIEANPLCYAHNLYLNNELITELVIPDSVTSIGSSAFWGCYGLIKITIPNSVTSIGEEAFLNCRNLTIYCEAVSRPSGWNNNWNGTCPVVWGYKPD